VLAEPDLVQRGGDGVDGGERGRGLVVGVDEHDDLGGAGFLVPRQDRAELVVVALERLDERLPSRLVAERQARDLDPRSHLHLDHDLYPFPFMHDRKLRHEVCELGVPATRQGGSALSGGKNIQYSLRFSTRQPWASAALTIFLRSPR
jgi:hypothetical protein